jgi:hypothetical protein
MEDYQRAWLDSLLDASWRHGGTLPVETEHLCKLAEPSSPRKFREKCGPVLAHFEVFDTHAGPVLIHSKLALQFIKAVERCAAQSGKRKGKGNDRGGSGDELGKEE